MAFSQKMRHDWLVQTANAPAYYSGELYSMSVMLFWGLPTR
jgi:hypothetical protein